MIMFAVNDAKSFLSISNWIDRVQAVKKDIPLAIVASKIDLPQPHAVDIEEAKKFCAEKHLPFFEMSAKSGVGVDKSVEIFLRLAEAHAIQEALNEKANSKIELSTKKITADPPPSLCCSGSDSQ